ncbi:alkaline shock response membrane anchor protein AmaP [Spirillospora sp. CA-294931]|uniref:alkaline shock response membrane anchor protein AmaP n=1 Tax=Spirillospora sp. CA-294931 TaxID=3240042 RepID=UPI003D8E1EF4
MTSRRTGRGNRLGLAAVGVALLAAGGAALARGAGLSPSLLGEPDVPVLDRRTRDFADDQVWFWPALATTAIVVALMGLRWLAVQTRTDAVRSMSLEADRRKGATRMPARALTGAVQDDLASAPDLRGARATLAGTVSHPHLRLTVTLDPDADVPGAKLRIQQALDRASRALETEHLTATVHLRTGRN